MWIKAFVSLCCLFFVTPVWAQSVECTYFIVQLPESWMVVQEPKFVDGMVTASFGRMDKAVSVFCMAGRNMGADARRMAADLARELKATSEPVAHKGQYLFSYTVQGIISQAVVAVDKDLYLFVGVMGDITAGQAFVRDCLSSQNYPGMIPKYGM